MPREKLALQRNNIIRDYSNGISATQLGAKYSVSTTTITRVLKGAGVMEHLGRGDATRRTDEAQIVDAFRSGVKPSEILTQFNVSKSCFYTLLRNRNVQPRGHLGDRPTEHSLRKRAVTLERTAKCNPSEEKVRELLSKQGLHVTPQVALGTGNIDHVLTGHSIAVEICLRGTFNKYLADGWMVQRIRDCANCGWHTYILGSANANDITDHSIEDILAWVKFLDRAPPSRRQYRVVWGGTELLATGCSDDDEITLVNAAGYASKVANRKHNG